MSDAQTQRTVKKRVVKKSAAAKKTITEDPWKGDLDPGDRVEFGATVEVKNRRGQSYWPKAGVSIAVRPGETVDQAKARAARVVHGFLDEQVAAYLAN